MKYCHYSIEDFINDNYFIKSVKSPDKESEAFWRNFMANFPHKKQEINQAKHFILQFSQDVNTISPEEENEEWQKLMNRIDRSEKSPSSSFWRSGIYKYAAVLIPLLITVFSVIYMMDSQKLKYKTHAQEKKTLTLPDKSNVILNSESKLTYREDPEKGIREAWIEGEAYFDIAENKLEGNEFSRFIVHTGSADVEVIGTSFNIKTRKDKVCVVLNSGKIKLSLEDTVKNVLMNPGELVEINSGQNLIVKKVNPDFYSAWRNDKINFKGIPLKEVEEVFEYNYDIDIIKFSVSFAKLRNEILKEEKFRGTLLLNEDADVFLKTLSEIYNLRVIHEKDHVILRKN